MTARLTRLLRASALPLLLAACHETPTEAPPLAAAAAPTLALTCQASVREHSVRCGVPARAGRVNGALVLGGQGVYVLLSSTNVSYDAATGVFAANVRVHNLTAQQLGTADGTTASGIKVFFQSGPTVTAGTGTVTVANADGTGTFLGSDQPYFAYPQFIEPQDSTAARQWRFAVPPTVDHFAFAVYVQAELPAEQGVLRWLTSRQPLTAQTLSAVWASTSGEAFSVGAGGAIAYFDGRHWARMSSPVSYPLHGVSGRSPTDVFAVGDGGVLHYDGSLWSSQLSSGLFAGVWAASGTGDAFAVGVNGLATHYDGSGWVNTPSGTSNNLRAVWGTSATNVYAVGDGDVLLRWNGSSWSTFGTGTGENLTGVWASSPSNLWVTTEGGALLHYNGTVWTTVAQTNFIPLRGVTGRTGEVYAVGDEGTVLRWNGTLTTLARPAVVGLGAASVGSAGNAGSAGSAGSAPAGSAVGGTASAAAAEPVFVVGDQGTIATFDGASWTVQENAAGYTGVWGSGTSDIYAVNSSGLVSHFDGSGWQFVSAPVLSPLRSLAGSGPSDVYAGGDGGALMHFDGSTWSTMAAPSAGALPVTALWTPGGGTLFAATAGDPVGDAFDPSARLTRYVNGAVAQSTAAYDVRGIWGTGPNLAFASGDSAEVARWDGSTWSTSLARNGFASLFGIWGSSASDVYAVGDFTLRHWDGSAWTAKATPGTYFKAVWGSSASDVFAVGDAGTVWHYNGSRWNAQFAGTNASFTGVWGTSPTDVYAVGGSGTLLHGTR